MKHIIVSPFWKHIKEPDSLYECQADFYDDITVPIQGNIPTEMGYKTINRIGEVLYDGALYASAQRAKKHYDGWLRKSRIVEVPVLKEGKFSVVKKEDGLIITDQEDHSDRCLLFANCLTAFVNFGQGFLGSDYYPTIIRRESTGEILREDSILAKGSLCSAEIITLLEPGQTLALFTNYQGEDIIFEDERFITIYTWDGREIKTERHDYYSEEWRRRQRSKEILESPVIS
ncbi:MAG: hypothetical protein Q7S53_02035 [bacterium]|nr:hypothetical protein [bacterium]